MDLEQSKSPAFLLQGVIIPSLFGPSRLTCRAVRRLHPEQTVALIHRLLAMTFAVVGLLFVAAPNATVRAINALGSIFRVFPPAPESELRFWLSLGFAYMVLVTLLAWRIAGDPRGQRALMPLLAAGKFASSFTCLCFFLLQQATFLYLLNFLVDGSIVVLVLGCYLWLGMAEQTAQAAVLPAGRVAELLRLLLGTMVPDGAAVPRLEQAVWRYFTRLHPLGGTALSAILYLLEFAPYLFGPRRRRFSALSAPEREAYLSGWETSRLALRRQLINGIKLAVMLHYYDSPAACAAIGYDGAYLRDKLLAGPNAEFHRARLA